MRNQGSAVFITIASVATLAGCSFPHAIRAPAITKDLPYDGDGATSFDRKVKSEFPIGSEESAMHAELTREGFTIHQAGVAYAGSPQQFEATAMTNDSVCDMTWIINWTSQDGKLTYVAGKSFGVCY
jgi:hypothetical protein